MTEAGVEPPVDKSVSRRPASKQGVPRGDLKQAETLATALWEAARLGSVSQGAFARQLIGPQGKPSGGHWRSRMALLRVFGLAEDAPNDELRLSKIGRQIVNVTAAEAQAAARREAVMYVKPYATLLKSSQGAALPSEASIAGTFEFTYGLSRDTASQAAQYFLASARLAGFIDNAGTVQLEGDESTAEGDDLRSVASPETDQASTYRTTSFTPAPEGQIGSSSKQPYEENLPFADLKVHNTQDPQRPSAPSVGLTAAPNVTMTLSLDLSAWDPDDVLRVLRVLGLSATDDK